MNKKALAAVLAVALGLGGAVLAVAGPASAHTGNLNSSASCNQVTGKYDVTYTLTTANTTEAGITKWKTVDSQTFQGIPSSNTGLTLGPVSSVGSQTITLGTVSVPGSALHAPWAYAFTTWTPDGFTAGSDGGNIDLAGTCTIPVVIPKDAAAAITVTAPTCAANGWASYTGTANVATPLPVLNETVGTHTPAAIASAAGHQFGDGSTSLQLADYTIAGATGYQSNHKDAPCYQPPGSIKCSGTSLGNPPNEAGDLAPVKQNDGLHFDGPTAVGQANDFYYRVTGGNAQGVSDIIVTYSGVSVTFPAQVVEEVSAANFPGSGFGTLSTNLSAAQAVGTVNVSTSADWYSSKITSGPGSLAWLATNHESYADLVSLIGTNHLLSAPSLHLQSNSPASAHSVVAALSSSCGAFSYLTSATPPTPPTNLNGGDVNPLQPLIPVGLAALLVMTIIGLLIKARKDETATL